MVNSYKAKKGHGGGNKWAAAIYLFIKGFWLYSYCRLKNGDIGNCIQSFECVVVHKLGNIAI